MSLLPIKVRKTTLKSPSGRIVYQVYVEGVRALGTIEHQPKATRRGPWVFILSPDVAPSWLGYTSHRRPTRAATRKELELMVTARSYGERAPMRVYAQWRTDDQGARVLGLLGIRNGVPAYVGEVARTIEKWIDSKDAECVEYVFSEGTFRLRRDSLDAWPVLVLNREFERVLADMKEADAIPKWWTYAGMWGAA